jgi:subtilisin family serine protease
MERLLREGVPGNVVVEPELKRELTWSYPLPLELVLRAQGSDPPPTGFGQTLNVRVQSGGQSLVGVKAVLVFANVAGLNNGTRLELETGANGEAAFTYNPALWRPNLLMLEPKSGFWDWWQELPQGDLSIDLPALPKTGPLGWWHQVVGMQRYTKGRGQGIRIGVVDTGVGPHPYVEHVRSIGAVTGGQYDPGAGQDVVGHGTHVSGLIRARPVEGSGDYCGIADGAEIFCVRVFTPDGQTNQGDVAEAIDRLVLEHDVHLINLSLGGTQPSQIEQDALRTALDYGTLCIAASGNSFSQPVMYPAAYPEAVAISAVGLVGVYPPGTMEAHSLPTLPTQLDLIGPYGLFVADFSNVGPETSCTAPGVGIISTVPARPEVVAPYAVANGTSMAAPIVSASLATVLAQDANYRALPSRVERAQWASAVLLASLRPLGLSWVYVGGGLVQAWPG